MLRGWRQQKTSNWSKYTLYTVLTINVLILYLTGQTRFTVWHWLLFDRCELNEVKITTFTSLPAFSVLNYYNIHNKFCNYYTLRKTNIKAILMHCNKKKSWPKYELNSIIITIIKCNTVGLHRMQRLWWAWHNQQQQALPKINVKICRCSEIVPNLLGIKLSRLNDAIQRGITKLAALRVERRVVS